ncbi:GntR family transcriptional regulator [Gordonia bronchialis]|uniref:GntR family transcriptional regulator n=1 Tax=Gordonia bronchialis TaxID=2054 RepID=UPI00242B7159|nr:GntR family transcriptional regulator [Gordonia bronchialis]
MSSSTLVAADHAYTSTKARIVSGELAGGTLLSEAQVGTELGVSRTPVHEAFLRLADEQLLELIPRRGAVVRPITPTEAADVLAMRRGIENTSAEQVFARGGVDADLRQRLAANLERQQTLVGSGDAGAFAEADDEFHALMIEASANPIARHFYAQLSGRQQRLRNVWLRIDPDNLAAAHADHEQLAAHLIGGDRSAFTSVLAAHFDKYQGAL